MYIFIYIYNMNNIEYRVTSISTNTIFIIQIINIGMNQYIIIVTNYLK